MFYQFVLYIRGCLLSAYIYVCSPYLLSALLYRLLSTLFYQFVLYICGCLLPAFTNVCSPYLLFLISIRFCFILSLCICVRAMSGLISNHTYIACSCFLYVNIFLVVFSSRLISVHTYIALSIMFAHCLYIYGDISIMSALCPCIYSLVHHVYPLPKHI